MSQRTRISLLAAVLLFFEGAENAAAQGSAGAPARLTARSQVVYTITIDPNAAPGLPAGADAVAFDRSNRLYILDRANRFVYVYRADGALDRRVDLRQVVEAPLQMTVTRDDRIVVSDIARKSFISIAAADPRQSTSHPFGTRALSGPLMANPQGGVVTQARSVAEADLQAGTLPAPQMIWFPLDGRGPVVLHTFARTAGSRGPRNPLTPAALAAPLPGRGAAVATSDAYRIQVSRDGRTREIVRAVAARAVAARDREWAQQQSGCEQVMMIGPSGRTRASSLGAGGAGRDLPTRMPVLRGLGVAPDGRIWVERTPADPGRPGPVDVFDADGRLVGEVDGVGVPAAWALDGETTAYVSRDSRCRFTVQVRRVRLAEPR